MHTNQTIGTVLYWAVIAILVGIALTATATSVGFPGGVRAFTVQSGSMEPSLRIGSIVIIRPSTEYRTGDVITYTSGASQYTGNTVYNTTHRIINISVNPDGTITYRTQGDANTTPDYVPVASQNVLGKVIYHLPFAGYPVAFVKTRTGFFLFILIPAGLYIFQELMTVIRETKKLSRIRGGNPS